jgi:hypothetical protein
MAGAARQKCQAEKNTEQLKLPYASHCLPTGAKKRRAANAEPNYLNSLPDSFQPSCKKRTTHKMRNSKEIEIYSIAAMPRKETAFCAPCEYGRFICWKNVGSSTRPFN